ncbi:hypothetical protein BH09BAC6_BH09BAC6_26540 [soil metagenome]|jgi:hypothetical protein
MLTFQYYLVAEWLCFIASILLLKNATPRFWLVIKYYLFWIVLLESICFYFVKAPNINDNISSIYNVAMVIEFSFGIWMIYKIVNDKRLKYIFVIGYLIFLTTFSFQAITHDPADTLHIYHDKAYLFGSAVMIILCIIYYYHLFQKEEYINLQRDPAFWFVSAFFIFYTTSGGYNGFFPQLQETQDNNVLLLGYTITNILSSILYGFWIVSFICIKKTVKFTQQL